MNNNILLDAALNYAANGLAVIPLIPNNKRPIIKNWPALASTDPEQIRAWWDENPHANIGIVGGPKSGNLVIVDVDNKNGVNGSEELDKFSIINGCLPSTRTVRTPTGGYHYYLRYAAVAKTCAGILKGVDIRAAGGYVVAPPSAIDGKSYKVISNADIADGGGVLGALLGDHTGAAVPDPFEELCRKKAEKFVMPEEIPEGTRNEQLYKLGCSVRFSGVDEDGIRALLMEENLNKCIPPLSDEEVRIIAKQAAAYTPTISWMEMKRLPEPDVQRRLEVKRDRSGNVKVLDTRVNIQTVMENDSRLRGLFRFNELSGSVWVIRQPPWNAPEGVYELRNSDIDNLLMFLEREYHIHDSGAKLQSVFNVVANANNYNPIIDYFKNDLPLWDGRPHIANLLPDYLGADKTELNTEIMKLWMLEAVNRAFVPGCKADYMLVLAGPQGIGKTYFLSQLAINPEWHTDNFGNLQGDGAFEKLRGKWILELGELLAVKRADTQEAVKAFITSTNDSYRPKYGKVTEAHPRRCVFAGTTNDMQFLRDRTGNRRFMPIQVGVNEKNKSMFTPADGFQNEILQAWAETFHTFRTGNRALILPEHLNAQLNKVREGFVEEDWRQGRIEQYLEGRTGRVCAKELWDQALYDWNQTVPPATVRDIRELSTIMRTFDGVDGWDYIGRQRCGSYGLQNCIEKIAESEQVNTKRTDCGQPESQ